MTTQNRNSPQISATVSEEDKECLEKMTLELSTKFNKVLTKSDVLRSIIKYASENQEELLEHIKEIEEENIYIKVTVPMKDFQKVALDKIAKNIMRSREFDGAELDRVRITANSIIRALIDCAIDALSHPHYNPLSHQNIWTEERLKLFFVRNITERARCAGNL